MKSSSESAATGYAQTILVVDDDPIARALLETILVSRGYERPACLEDPRLLEKTIDTVGAALVLLDLNMPYVSGQESLELLSSNHPDIPVIVITSEDSIETAVECMRLGAFDFMTKPIERNRLTVAVRNAFEYRALRTEMNVLNTRLRSTDLANPAAFEPMKTQDGQMAELFRYVEAISASEQAVLITGESGTGKELLAYAVHEASRPGKPFVPVNVAGLDDTMFSDTLFGHRAGAYTGADTYREGLAAKAADGTLFLDEIGDLTTQSQTKLLRLIQEREYYPLGADEAKRVNARIVTATNAEVEARVEAGVFRKDLYYRLLTHRIHIPPLRARTGDVSLLLGHFARAAYAENGVDDGRLPAEITTPLLRYTFPGNVRELRSVVFDAVSRLRAGVEVVDIAEEIERDYAGASGIDEKTADRLLGCFERFPTLKEVEALLIDAALKRCDGNQSQAAKLIGLSQSTLSRRAKP